MRLNYQSLHLDNNFAPKSCFLRKHVQKVMTSTTDITNRSKSKSNKELVLIVNFVQVAS